MSGDHGGGAGHKEIDADLQAKILSDPQVQKLIKEGGERALSNPEVQEQILRTCKEKFPECAGSAAAAAKAWAADPATQARAKAAASAALGYAANAGDLVLRQIEQGPAGVRTLTFLTSCASLALAVLELVNPLRIFGHAVTYAVAVYQVVFAGTAMLFEVPPHWHVRIQERTGLPISSYQDMLIANARFLSLVGGRGLFYSFQGTLWLALSSEILEVAVGLALVSMGALHLLMHFDVMPQTVAQKMRDGFKRMETSSDDAAPRIARIRSQLFKSHLPA